MAVTNFRASDFPSGKKSKEKKSEAREDTKALNKQAESAVDDPKEGAKAAKETEKKVTEADKALAEEISKTETPLEEQGAPKKAATRRTATKKAE